MLIVSLDQHLLQCHYVRQHCHRQAAFAIKTLPLCTQQTAWVLHSDKHTAAHHCAHAVETELETGKAMACQKPAGHL